MDNYAMNCIDGTFTPDTVCIVLLRIKVISTNVTNVFELHLLFIFLGNGTGGESIYGGYFAGAVPTYILFQLFFYILLHDSLQILCWIMHVQVLFSLLAN